jgi:hypothetical protein
MLGIPSLSCSYLIQSQDSMGLANNSSRPIFPLYIGVTRVMVPSLNRAASGVRLEILYISQRCGVMMIPWCQTPKVLNCSKYPTGDYDH